MQHHTDTFSIYNADCLDVLRALDDASIDSVVTDPPYGINFMNKGWDNQVPGVDVWAECLRVLKPGGYLLAFAGTRTQHRMATRIEDAGFEIRDMIAWIYGSGFPKSVDISKQIDKSAGAEGKIIGERRFGKTSTGQGSGWNDNAIAATGRQDVRAPATDTAKQWSGWGSALKPAMEPITVARKPFKGSLYANVLEHGVGGLNIDGCRVGESRPASVDDANKFKAWKETDGNKRSPSNNPDISPDIGRWPANLIHDGSDEVDNLFPGEGAKSAARFFYCPKASKKDRDEGLDDFEVKRSGIDTFDPRSRGSNVGEERRPLRANTHATVKPTDLMRYLCRLVTPPGGVVLDPFLGSGSTGKAAIREGFKFIGVELDAEYYEIAKARISSAL